MGRNVNGYDVRPIIAPNELPAINPVYKTQITCHQKSSTKRMGMLAGREKNERNEKNARKQTAN